MEAQVRFPFAAMVVAYWLAEQSVGFEARAEARGDRIEST
jgi:hypothetical protein